MRRIDHLTALAQESAGKLKLFKSDLLIMNFKDLSQEIIVILKVLLKEIEEEYGKVGFNPIDHRFILHFFIIQVMDYFFRAARNFRYVFVSLLLNIPARRLKTTWPISGFSSKILCRVLVGIFRALTSVLHTAVAVYLADSTRLDQPKISLFSVRL